MKGLETYYRRHQVESIESIKKKSQEQSFSKQTCIFSPILRSESEKYSISLYKQLFFSLNKNQSMMHVRKKCVKTVTIAKFSVSIISKLS